MDELEQQIAAWGNATMDGSGPPVTAKEVRARNTTGTFSRRVGVGSGWRWALGGGVAAAVLVFVALVAVVVDGRDDGPEQVRTSDGVADGIGGPSAEVSFEVLAMGPALMNGMGSFDAARNPEELSEVWADAGRPPPAPIVDFDEQIVLSITIPDDACPPELVAFDWLDEELDDRRVLQPRFVEPDRGCSEPLFPKTYLVAVDWATTGDDYWIRVPGQPTHGYDDANYRVARGELEAQGEWNRPAGDGQHDVSRLLMRAAIQASLLDGPTHWTANEAGNLALAVTLPDGTQGTLSWFEITSRRPEDARAGLERPTTVGTDSGGVVTVGSLADSSAAVRFDCDWVRYQLAGPTVPSLLLGPADALAAELDCEPPTTSAPTECLGLADDPVACAED